MSSPQLCYKDFQCIFPEAAEGISHCYVTEMAAHPHGTLQNCFLLNTPSPLLSPSPVETRLWDQTHSSKALPYKETQSLLQAEGKRRPAAGLQCLCPDRPVSGQPCAVAASPLQEIVENSFSSSSWLSVLKARFFLTLMLMDRT